MTSETFKQDLVVNRVFDAPLDRVWKAWHDPNDVMQWWGPDGFTAPVARMDFRVGGFSLVCMTAPEMGFGEMYSTWHYQEIVPQQRIDYIHNLADQDGNPIDPTTIGMPPDFPQGMRCVVDFKALNDHQTELTVTEFGYTSAQLFDLSKTGLEQCLDKMALLFAKS